MKIPLRAINLAGVIILAAVCCVQWRTNRAEHLAVIALEHSCRQQTLTIDELTRGVQGLTADLADLRDRSTATHTNLHEAESKVRQAEGALAQRTEECLQLKSSLTNWVAAVAQRDDRIAQMASQLDAVAQERVALATQFNGLAEKHNGIIKELNSRTHDLNALVERYNGLAKSGQAASSR